MELSKSRGFTLIEVIFSILILSGSLVVLLGLQSSAVKKTIRDNNQQAAMLIARNILASIEISEDVSERSIEGKVSTMLRDLNAYKAKDFESTLDLDNVDAILDISKVELPVPSLEDIDLIEMKKIKLSIAWGDLEDEKLDVVYFLPDDEN